MCSWCVSEAGGKLLACATHSYSPTFSSCTASMTSLKRGLRSWQGPSDAHVLPTAMASELGMSLRNQSTFGRGLPITSHWKLTDSSFWTTRT